MNARQITDTYHVSPQIEPGDAAILADQGFVRVICNRPDSEVPPALSAASVGEAVRAAGLEFEVLELTHQTMTPENVARQKQLADVAGGKVLAYCASGTRCSVIWALGQAGKMPTDDILAQCQKAGYSLDALRPTLDALSKA